jgi:hypothetical protein
VNGLDITRVGPGGEPPQLQVFAHTVSEGSHRDPPVRVGHEPSQRVYTNRKIRGHSVVRKRERKKEHRQDKLEPYRVAVSFNEEEFLWRGADTKTVLNGTAVPRRMEF